MFSGRNLLLLVTSLGLKMIEGDGEGEICNNLKSVHKEFTNHTKEINESIKELKTFLQE